MSLLRDCIQLSRGAVSISARTALVRAADQFIRAGGVLTLSEWAVLDELERAALIAARERLDAQRAAITGMAAQGREGMARALAPVDGSASLVRVRLEQALDRLEVGS